MEFPIEKILEGYSLSVPDRSVRKEAVTAIKEVTGVSVPFESVSYQNGRLRVDASPLLRSQLHIHKDTILKKLSEKLTNINVKDLR